MGCCGRRGIPGTHQGSIEGRAPVARKRFGRASELVTGVRATAPRPAISGLGLSLLLRGQLRGARGWSAGRSHRICAASFGIRNANWLI